MRNSTTQDDYFDFDPEFHEYDSKGQIRMKKLPSMRRIKKSEILDRASSLKRRGVSLKNEQLIESEDDIPEDDEYVDYSKRKKRNY